MSDPKETSEPVNPAPEAPLNETSPPMELHKKSADQAKIETLDQTKAETRAFLGSHDDPASSDS